MAKKDEPFHGAFKKLKGLRLRDRYDTPKKQKAVPPPRPVHDEATLFEQAMKGVMPIDNDLVAPPEPIRPEEVVGSIRNDMKRQDEEVMDALQGLVRGTARFDITCTGEYMEGHAIPMDPSTMKKLKDGEFTTQAHLDLHGYNRQAAEQALESFILNANALGYRVVLIIHGRGLKSSQGPVLKEHLIRWLTTGTLSHLILAFSSARPCDGGTGALYVMLKRRPKKSRFRRP